MRASHGTSHHHRLALLSRSAWPRRRPREQHGRGQPAEVFEEEKPVSWVSSSPDPHQTGNPRVAPAGSPGEYQKKLKAEVEPGTAVAAEADVVVSSRALAWFGKSAGLMRRPEGWSVACHLSWLDAPFA